MFQVLLLRLDFYGMLIDMHIFARVPAGDRSLAQELPYIICSYTTTCKDFPIGVILENFARLYFSCKFILIRTSKNTISLLNVKIEW